MSATNHDALQAIEEAYPSLSPAGRRVADRVLREPDSVPRTTLAALARDCGVSEPTVIRFCRTLGYGGFQQFKLELARSLAAGVPYVLEGVQADEPTEDLAAKIIDRHIATLVQARNHFSAAHLERAVDLLAAASRVEFYGHGASGIVAQDAQHKFFRLGLPTVAYVDPHVHTMAAAVLPADAVVVAISHTGRTRDLLESVALARQRGAAVIAVTAAGSPLAERCSVALYADVHEDTDVYTPMASRLVHLALLDVLSVGLALRRGPGLPERLERTKRELKEKRLRPL